MDPLKPPALLRTPNVIWMGRNAINNLDQEIKALNGRRVLLVSDPGVVRAGLAKNLEAILEKTGFQYQVFSDVEPEPSIATAEKCIAFAKKTEADIIVGVGGGSPIDVAKATAICGKRGNSIRDFLGLDQVPSKGLPMIAIPTTAGTGSEATPAIVLTDQVDHTKKTVWSRYVLTDSALIDPMMTVTMPPQTTADSGIDALSHAVEAYISVRSNAYADALALEAIRLIGGNLRKAYGNGKDLEAREHMSQAALLAGIAFGSSGLGAVHALGYPFTTFFGHSHGKGIGIVMPAVMRYNSSVCEEKFRRIAEAMGEKVDGFTLSEAALKAADGVEKLINDVGISTRISAYNIPESKLKEMAESAILPNARLLVSNPRKMGVPEALEVYQKIY